MQITYNLTGAKRKELVNAISQELYALVKYLGMPTASFEVGGYIIDKNGTLKGEDNHELIANLQGLHGFIPVSADYDEPINPAVSVAFEDIQLDGREELGLGQTHWEVWQGENGMQESDTPDIDQHNPGQYADPSIPMSGEMVKQIEEYYANNPPFEEEPDCLTIEMPITGFSPEKLNNLAKLVAAKASLIKVALGAEGLPIQQTADTLLFPWFKGDYTSDEVKAYTHFIAALCELAKKQTRVTASEKQAESEKYAFRCFLLRLGFIGPEYKKERKILLSKLSGSSAHKTLIGEVTYE